MGQDVPDGNLVVDKIINSACKVFLGGKVDRLLNRRYGQYTDTATYIISLLVNGTDAIRTLGSVNADALTQTDGLPITWESYVKCGVHPVDARAAGLPIIVRLSSSQGGDPNELLGHPLNIALMFAKHLNNIEAAEQCVVAHRQICGVLSAGVPTHHNVDNTKNNPWDAPRYYRQDDRYRSFGFWTKSWICPDPRNYGLADLVLRDASTSDLFEAFPLFSWYTEDAAKSLVSGKGMSSVNALEDIARTLCISGVGHAQTVLFSAAETVLKRQWDSARHDYLNLASLLRMVPKAVADTYIDNVKGSRSLLGICLSTATNSQMCGGLSALAQQDTDHVRYLSSLYGRAPLVSELCGLRAKKLVDIMYYMPASILKQVLEEDDSVERIRARLLREVQTADPTMLRAALTDHEKRIKLRPYVLLDDASVQIEGTNTTDKDWDAVYGELAARYIAASAFRARMTHLIADPATRLAATVVLSEKEKHGPMLDVLELLPDWQEIQALVENFLFLFKPLRAEPTSGS